MNARESAQTRVAVIFAGFAVLIGAAYAGGDPAAAPIDRGVGFQRDGHLIAEAVSLA